MTRRQMEITQDANIVVATLHGDIDLANVGAISDEILHAVANDALGLVIDLTAVRYLDSTGVHMLFKCLRRLKACDQQMAVAVAEDSTIRDILTISNLDEAVGVYTSPAQCVTALRDDNANVH